MTECCDTCGELWACKIVDISGTGLGIISSAALRKGEKINIDNPKIEALVVWAANGRAGLSVPMTMTPAYRLLSRRLSS